MCDVSDEASIINLINEIEKVWGQIDFIGAHAIAYSDKNELTGKYIETSKIIFYKQCIYPATHSHLLQTRTKNT